MSDLFTDLPSNARELLHRAARDFPDCGITIFDGRGRNPVRRTFAELHDLAVDAAARFDALGVGAEEPVIVALPTSWEWMEAWLGLLMRGAWPVASSAATGLAAADTQLAKVEAVMGDIGARRVVTSDGFRDQADRGGYSRASVGAVTLDELALVAPTPGFRPKPVGADDVAFLQLTSGSTGRPRAVMITHRGAVHNPAACSESAGGRMASPIQDWVDTMVSWLPLYHDMGLIGCLFLPLLAGFELHLLRPQTFLARPMIWLRELGTSGATFATAPNFGYQLCVERVRTGQLENADLSCFKVALTGAEMVRRGTADAFAEIFGGFGFEPESFLPCYGLAEGTLAVTFDGEGCGVRTMPAPDNADVGLATSEVVCLGRPVRDTRIEIRSPDGRRVAEDAVGEVCINGPGLFAGYYRDDAATAEALTDGWYRTGDLGFLHRGELYLTGRIKDILIIHGHNLMPDEIESLVDGVTGGGGMTRSAAFSVARGAGGEEAVLAAEVTTDDPDRLREIERDIRVAVGRALGLPLADVVFVRRGRIPRTTSGKMQRGELRRRYLDGSLEVIASEPGL